MTGVWVTWGRRRSAHHAPIDERDISNGGFPTTCGQWAPEALEVPEKDEPRRAEGQPRCKVCRRRHDEAL